MNDRKDKEVVLIRIYEDQRNRLARIAEAERRSMTAQLAIMLEPLLCEAERRLAEMETANVR